mmetsp:Transcript_1154/g.4037  ORF Transcript_1154/g.4037 Transcript_1154/m.4037 type:complete len:402 (+) Transcript_1154:601-1806(+)
MLHRHLLLLKAHDEGHHLVHGHLLGGSQVKRLPEVGLGDPKDALDAVVDEGEGPGLLSVTPHLHLVPGGEDLSAEGSGGLLPSPLPSSVGSVDVVESGDPALHLKVLAVVHVDLLGRQLLQAVGVLRGSGPGIRLLESTALDLRVSLLVLRVDACGRGVEHPLGVVLPGSLKDVEGDHGVVVHDHSVVALDEAHAAHVRGEVEDVLAVLGDLHAVVKDAQVDKVELVAEHVLGHVLVPLPVARHDVVALLLQPLGKVAGDETSSARDADPQGLFRPVGLEGILGEVAHLLLRVRKARHRFSRFSRLSLFFFSRAKNGGEGECPRVSLWRPRRVGEPRPRYPQVVVLLRVRPTFGVVFAAKRSRRRRPRYFFSLSGARNEELRGSWFSIKAVGKIPITETPP